MVYHSGTHVNKNNNNNRWGSAETSPKKYLKTTEQPNERTPTGKQREPEGRAAGLDLDHNPEDVYQTRVVSSQQENQKRFRGVSFESDMLRLPPRATSWDSQQ